jgi:hypothetical protein
MLVTADPTCEPGYRTTSTATDLEGRFTMALDPGRYRFDYDPPPGAPVPRKTALDVSLSADVVHEVRLDQAAYVQGQVYAPNNKALAMAIVRLYKVRCRSDSDCFGPSRTAPLLIAQARTDATGKFVAVVPGPCGEPGKSTCDGDGGSE